MARTSPIYSWSTTWPARHWPTPKSRPGQQSVPFRFACSLFRPLGRSRSRSVNQYHYGAIRHDSGGGIELNATELVRSGREFASSTASASDIIRWSGNEEPVVYRKV